MRCKRCGAEGPERQSYCRRCGAFAEGFSATCENHIGLDAAGVCVVCGKPLCSECGTRRGEGWYCEEGHHAALASDFVLLGIARSLFEADALSVNLRSIGIGCEVIDRNRYLAFLEERRPEGAFLLVLPSDLDRARNAIAEFDLHDFLDEDISL